MHLVARVLVLTLAVVAAPGAWSQAPVAGRDFTVIVPSQPTSDATRVVVTEFFSYQCPHCYAFSQPFKAWAAALPKDVLCTREAVTIGHEVWEPSARAFYALKSIHKLDTVDDALFNAIHRERIPLTTEAQISSWLETKGVSKQDFASAYRSFGVNVQFNRGDQLTRAVKLPSVPAIVIDGKYLVAIANNIDYGKQLAVVDALIARARAEKKR